MAGRVRGVGSPSVYTQVKWSLAPAWRPRYRLAMARRRNGPRPPLLVALAQQLALVNGFEGSCDASVGWMLRTLTALARGKALDLGTGFGVSAAWMLDGLDAGRRLITIDFRPERCERVQPLFTPFANVTLLCGDWRDALAHGPFGIAFVSAAPAQEQGIDDVIDALHVGGLAVLDHYAPAPSRGARHDPRRHAWLRHPRLAASEIVLGDGRAMVIATRAR
jgi:predicted O-methyltransferase YrrM